MRLPAGFRVRLRSDVHVLGGGAVLVGGSPLRVLKLSARARSLLGGGEIEVVDDDSSALASRLLVGNLADPQPGEPAKADDLTVVIPVRDRPEQLDRTLAALEGLACIVVDDASHDPSAVGAVAARHGARLVPLSVNRGPAGARNAGLGEVRTPYVAFVDSDVEVAALGLLALAAHFADPTVALVGPRVKGVVRSSRPRWHERYDAAASSLDLGRRLAVVRPGAMIGWLPSACLVARVEALEGGFSDELRVGEDVDLVWRLVESGRVVRYDPSVVAQHDVRSGLRAWLGRKVVYGGGGAELGRRHGDAIAPAILTPAMAIAGAAVLQRRWWSFPVAGLATTYNAVAMAKAIPPVPRRAKVVAELGARSLGWAVVQESSLVLRHWWPGFAVASLFSRRVRRAVVTALLVDSVVVRLQREEIEPVTGDLARRLDDVAYGAGLWLGVARGLRREGGWDPTSLRALAPRIIRRTR